MTSESPTPSQSPGNDEEPLRGYRCNDCGFETRSDEPGDYVTRAHDHLMAENHESSVGFIPEKK